jgi:hypothetical protein
MSALDSTANRRVRPTLDTPFHIDYEWWSRDARGLRAYLVSHLPLDKQDFFTGKEDNLEIDWIDPDTAEVKRLDALQLALQEAAQQSEFIADQTSLVDAVFRVFLANDNTPLSPNELGEETRRNPNMILRTLSGATVYKGLRPVTD